MNYLSVCSGIEAATVAWHQLGWNPVGFSEIEKFPSAVLNHHYPHVTNFGDMTKYKEWNINDTVDLLVGGTPCQSFSVAGLRKGLDDPRGNLALVYCGMLDHFKPKWFVWENVPGVLSSGGGRDFGSFLGAVVKLGYGFSYRVLDAQYFGVAQRRRRVFVVGHLGDWRPAASVLFERHSLCGHPAPSREKGEEVAGTIAARFGISRNNHEECVASFAIQGSIIGSETTEAVAKCITTKTRHGAETETLIPTYAIQGSMIGRSDNAGPQGNGINEEICFTQNTTDRHAVAQPIPLNTMTMQGRPSDDGRMGSGIGKPGDPCPTLTKGHSHAVAQPVYELHGQDSRVRELKDVCSTVLANYGTGGGNVPITLNTLQTMGKGNGLGIGQPGNPMNTLTKGDRHAVAAFKGGQGSAAGGIGYDEHVSPTLSAANGGNRTPTLLQAMAVRRLTATECERLQGFPDNYTNIPWRGKPDSPDGPRYKSLGNSMAVPVMEWIGKRVNQYERMEKKTNNDH